MKRSLLLISALCVFALNSCRLMFPNRMFEQGSYEFFKEEIENIDDYLIQSGDLLNIQIFARDGFDLLDVLNNEVRIGINNQARSQLYLVDLNGYVDLPIFGKLNVAGYKETDLEKIIEAKSSELFNDPFVVIRVSNRRVFLFKGSEGSVVPLNEAPTSLIEVLALSGGLNRNLKAYKVKIIRGNLENPKIITVDLSSMENLGGGNLILQTNDVVYIEERLRVASAFTRELSTILSLVSAITSIIVLSRNL